MKIHECSDLHLDVSLSATSLELPGGEVLIVAGDMCEAASFGRNDDKTRRKVANGLKRFISDEFAKYRLVLYVPGNHEYYRRSIPETEKLLKLNIVETCPNVKLLQNEAYFSKNVVFLGTTLWTDVNKDDPLTHNCLKRQMNDFIVIDGFSTHKCLETHRKALEWLGKAYDEYSKDYDKIVVITHHAPSELSVHEMYKDDYYVNGGYRSSLDNFILDRPKINIWFHGHMHTPLDYPIGDTRILCNPRGYYGYDPNAYNFKVKELEI